MKARTLYTTCIIVMVVSVAVMAYDHFVAAPAAIETYVISDWTLADSLLARPALLTAAGALICGVLSITSAVMDRYRKIMLIAGIGVLTIYAIIAICMMADVRTGLVSETAYFAMKFPYIFLLPGALVGIGAVKKR